MRFQAAAALHPIQVIDAGHAQAARCIIKAVKVNECQTHAQQSASAVFNEAVNPNQCKHQKRQIIDKHQLKMCMKKTPRRRIKHAAGKRRPSPCRILPAVSLQPDIHQIAAKQKLKDCINAEDVFHPDTRKQASQQNIRPQQSVIGKIIYRRSAAQIYIKRKQPARFQHRLPERLRNRQMLTQPVRAKAKEHPLSRCCCTRQPGPCRCAAQEQRSKCQNHANEAKQQMCFPKFFLFHSLKFLPLQNPS